MTVISDGFNAPNITLERYPRGLGRYACAASTKLISGTLVSWNTTNSNVVATAAVSSGYATQPVMGITAYEVDNSSGISGAESVSVETGVVTLQHSGLTLADLGKPVFAIDHVTVSKDPSQGKRPYVGTLVNIDGVNARVQIEPWVPTSSLVESYRELYAGDAAADTTVAERVTTVRFDKACQVTKVTLTPTGAVTASASVYATITLNSRTDALPGTAVALAVFKTDTAGANSGTGNWVAFTDFDVGTFNTSGTPGVLVNTTMAAGTIFTLTIAKASTGTQLPSFNLLIETVRT